MSAGMSFLTSDVVGGKRADADVDWDELSAFVCGLTGTVGVDVAGVCSAIAVG